MSFHFKFFLQRAKKHGLGESLFSRLASCMENWTDDIPVILLQQQYRMHKEIADYPNRAFYDSKIETVIAPRPKLTIPPYLVMSISSGDKGQGYFYFYYTILIFYILSVTTHLP